MSSSWTIEVETVVPAPHLFKAVVLDWHNLAPKIASEKIVSAAVVEGTGGAGTIYQFNYAPGGPFTLLKERLDFLDVEKCDAKFTLLEGGGLGITIECGSSHVKVEPKAKGSVIKQTVTYKPLPGVNVEEEKEKYQADVNGVINGCEAFLVANPDAYN